MPKKGYKGALTQSIAKVYSPDRTSKTMAEMAGATALQVRNYCYANNLEFKSSINRITIDLVRDVQENLILGSRTRGAKYFADKWGVSTAAIYRVLDMKVLKSEGGLA